MQTLRKSYAINIESNRNLMMTNIPCNNGIWTKWTQNSIHDLCVCVYINEQIIHFVAHELHSVICACINTQIHHPFLINFVSKIEIKIVIRSNAFQSNFSPFFGKILIKILIQTCSLSIIYCIHNVAVFMQRNCNEF